MIKTNFDEDLAMKKKFQNLISNLSFLSAIIPAVIAGKKIEIELVDGSWYERRMKDRRTIVEGERRGISNARRCRCLEQNGNVNVFIAF